MANAIVSPHFCYYSHFIDTVVDMRNLLKTVPCPQESSLKLREGSVLISS